MKKILLFAICALVSTTAFSQTNFEKGQIDLNFGVGFPNTTHTAIDGASSLFNIDGDENGSSTPFFNVSGVYGVTENIGVGLYAGYFQSDSEILATGNALLTALNALGANINAGDAFGQTKYNVFSIGGKLEVHRDLLNIEKLDTYASTYLGYNIVNDSFDDVNYVNEGSAEYNVPLFGTINLNTLLGETISNINYPTFTYEVNAGGRYDLNENVAIFGEAGLGRFLVNAGLTYHINKTKGAGRDSKPNARDY